MEYDAMVPFTSPFCPDPWWRAEYDLEMADAAALDTMGRVAA